MFQESDRVYLRHYLGYSGIWIQAEPRLENAIQAVQSISDGGSRPDSSTETYIKALIYGAAAQAGPPAIPAVRGLLQIEFQISQMDTLFAATKADEVQVDAYRETARLRSEGRRLCAGIAGQLGMRGVRVDMFSAAPVVKDDDPFMDAFSRQW